MTPFPLTVSDSALSRIATVLKATTLNDDSEEDAVFRVQVLTGGCSGFKNIFEISQSEPDDLAYSQDAARIVIDPVSADLLKGSLLDYVEDLSGAEFVIKNPNAVAGCGCGQSFSL